VLRPPVLALLINRRVSFRHLFYFLFETFSKPHHTVVKDNNENI